MFFNLSKSFYLATVLFMMLLAGGFCLSQHKLLWLDELYTQQTAIDKDTYTDLFLLKFPDGNKNPLFYMVQKTVCVFSGYHLPADLSTERLRARDIRSQRILRMASNVYMSLALTLIFYFFTRFYSIQGGLYALSVALATPMVWMYWVEARPYSLWFLLTTVQLLLLLDLMRHRSQLLAEGKKEISFYKAKAFSVVHVLLALTTPTSMVQISIVTAMLWWRARYQIKALLLVGFVPLSIALLYYLGDQIDKIKTYMFGTNFFDVVMPERLFVYALYLLIALGLPQKYKKGSNHLIFAVAFFLFIASGFLVLWLDLFTQHSTQGFFSRYLMYITPMDILMFIGISLDLCQWTAENSWLSLNLYIILGGLVFVRGLMTYRDLLASAMYLHGLR